MNKLFYTEAELDAMGILSPSTRWRKRKEGTFPNTVALSQGRVAYPAAAIDKWIAELTNTAEAA